MSAISSAGSFSKIGRIAYACKTSSPASKSVRPYSITLHWSRRLCPNDRSAASSSANHAPLFKNRSGFSRSICLHTSMMLAASALRRRPIRPAKNKATFLQCEGRAIASKRPYRRSSFGVFTKCPAAKNSCIGRSSKPKKLSSGSTMSTSRSSASFTKASTFLSSSSSARNGSFDLRNFLTSLTNSVFSKRDRTSWAWLARFCNTYPKYSCSSKSSSLFV